jgi:hypothetical protein
MTDDQLISKAVKRLRLLESRCAERPSPLQDVSVDLLPNRRIRDAVVIYFECDDSPAKIQVFMDRESGDMISGGYFPPKQSEATPII